MNGYAAALWFALAATPAPAPSAAPPRAAPAVEKGVSAAPGASAVQAQPGPVQITAAPVVVAGPQLRGALEMTADSLPSGTLGGHQDLYASGLPLLSFDGGADFGFELGAKLRLRVFDDPPAQRAEDFGGILRREDWDERSDFGQLLRELRLGAVDSPVQLRAGGFAAYTLGSGALISRYANRLSPDYHPAGAELVVYAGATRIEAFASDVLAARIFAGEVAVDLARAFGSGPGSHDRYHLALQLAQDFGRAGGRAPPLSLAWLELDGALWRGERAQVSGYLGGGGRAFDDGGSLGATLGLSAEGQPRGARVGGRLEARAHRSGFRQGMIGFDYELARFSGIGLGLSPLAEERLPPGFSFYGEVAAAIGSAPTVSTADAAVVVSASGEYFMFGRTNLDVSLLWRGVDGRGSIGGRVAIVGLGEAPRYLGSVEGRLRFLPSLYAVASGGTVFFPQPGGSLARGFFLGAGVGADFAR